MLALAFILFVICAIFAVVIAYCVFNIAEDVHHYFEVKKLKKENKLY